MKLAVMNNFEKVIDTERDEFVFPQENSPWISMEKLKADIFDGPQVRELIKDPMFDEALLILSG